MLSDESRDQLQRYLVVSEAVRLKPYWDCCSRGLRQACSKGPTHAGRLTIGIGRNIEDNGISLGEAYTLNDHDIETAEALVVARYPWSQEQDPVRQAVLVELMFNMGPRGLGSFVNTLRAFEQQDYDAVAAGLEKSKWYRQVQPSRSSRILQMVRSGEWV